MTAEVHVPVNVGHCCYQT